jgi:uncharacterized membrane-anchored protein
MSALSLAEVLRRLEEEGLAAPGLADPGREAGERAAAVLAADEEEPAPWYLRLFILLGSWLGAFVAAFFLVVTELFSTAPPAAVLGVVLLTGAAAVSHRRKSSTFVHQLIWILTLGGQVAVLVAVSYTAGRGEAEAVLLTLALLQIPTLALIPHPPLRLASAFTLVAAATAWLVKLAVPFGLDTLAVATAVAVTALWLGAHKLAAGPGGALWRPLALGLAAGLPAPLVTLLWSAELGSRGAPLPSLPAAVTAALAVLALVTAGTALAEQGRRLLSPPGLLAAAGIAAVAAVAHDVPGLMAALLLGLLAHLRRDRLLEALALLSLAFFLGFFYYRLETPLLEKSLWVTATGVVVVLLGAAVGRFFAPGSGDRRRGPLPLEGAAALRLAAALALALGLIAVSVAGKERLLATGTTVLLELRPVDPRSLIQGDYMALRYALERQVAKLTPLDELPRNGRLVLALDAEGVGRFVRLWEGGALQPGEQLLRYRVRTRRWGGEELRLGAESFFFEEGAAELYQNAEYGELKVAADGESVLVGLRDAELRPLGDPKDSVTIEPRVSLLGE